MNKPYKDRIDELFTERGLRSTSQRRALYEALSATAAHPTADQLFYEVGGRTSGMSLATVYNTLEAFCQVGLASRVYGQGGSVRYDAVIHNHLHTRCKVSGAIHDVPDDLGDLLLKHLPRKALKEIESSLGFKINRVHVELVGEYT